MENTNKFGYFAKDVALDIGITTSTLRRWAIELEKEGYTIERNEKDQRIYFERDFKALRELKKLLAHNVSFADAIKAVTSMSIENKNVSFSPSVYKQELRLSKSELQEIVHHEVKKAVEEEREVMFQAFEDKLNDSLEARDRQLTLSMKNLLDDRQKQIAATKEKKRWWRNFFK